MFIKLDLIGMKINRTAGPEYTDPVLQHLHNDEDDNDKRVLTSIINVEKENIIEIIPSFEENQTQFNIFDKEGNDLVYMVNENYDIFVDKIKRVFNLEIIDFKNV